jgi:hypothetical protein
VDSPVDADLDSAVTVPHVTMLTNVLIPIHALDSLHAPITMVDLSVLVNLVSLETVMSAMMSMSVKPAMITVTAMPPVLTVLEVTAVSATMVSKETDPSVWISTNAQLEPITAMPMPVAPTPLVDSAVNATLVLRAMEIAVMILMNALTVQHAQEEMIVLTLLVISHVVVQMDLTALTEPVSTLTSVPMAATPAVLMLHAPTLMVDLTAIVTMDSAAMA